MDYRERLTEPHVVNAALGIYIDMAHFFLYLQKNGIAFTDAKNYNFIFNRHGQKEKQHQIVVTDTKGFVAVDKNLYYDVRLLDNKWQALISTPIFNPPEFPIPSAVYTHDDTDKYRRGTFNADKLHVFVLGRNLYQFLTDSKDEIFVDKCEVSSYDFTQPIFNKSSAGWALAALIKQMLEPNFDQRITLINAKDQLEKIKNRELIRTKDANGTKLHNLSNTQKVKDWMSESAIILQDIQKKRDINSKPFSSLETLSDLNQQLSAYENNLEILKSLDPSVDARIKLKKLANRYSRNDEVIAYSEDKLEAAGRLSYEELDALEKEVQSYLDDSEQVKSLELRYKNLQQLDILSRQLDILSRQHSSSVMSQYIKNKRELVNSDTLSLADLDKLNTKLQYYIDHPNTGFLKRLAVSVFSKPKPPSEKYKQLLNAEKNIQQTTPEPTARDSTRESDLKPEDPNGSFKK
jgi:hypothetical protein